MRANKRSHVEGGISRANIREEVNHHNQATKTQYAILSGMLIHHWFQTKLFMNRTEKCAAEK